jgi:L-alanine-DL-glutamate epimerase-like enolase superfamily enzyme
MTSAPPRIVRATVRVHGGATAGAKNARSQWSHRQGLLLTLEDSQGNRGIGEASPLPGYTIDELPAVEQVLRSINWAPLPPVPEADRVLPWVRGILAPLPATTPAASCAVEAALLDLVSRGTNTPILDIFGTYRPSIRIAHLLHIEDKDALPRAEALVASGVGTLKVKIGRSGAFDAELRFLRALRTRLGHDVNLRFDANGGLGGSGLRERLLALMDLRPQLIEEPATEPEMAELGEGPWIVGLDESLFRDAEACIRSRCGPGTFVVLKPMALGGMVRCLELASAATSAGGRVVVTHTFDGPVGWSVATALALITHDSDVDAGLAPHPGLSAWPRHELPGLDDQVIRARKAPGWGIAGASW